MYGWKASKNDLRLIDEVIGIYETKTDLEKMYFSNFYNSTTCFLLWQY